MIYVNSTEWALNTLTLVWPNISLENDFVQRSAHKTTPTTYTVQLVQSIDALAVIPYI